MDGETSRQSRTMYWSQKWESQSRTEKKNVQTRFSTGGSAVPNGQSNSPLHFIEPRATTPQRGRRRRGWVWSGWVWPAWSAAPSKWQAARGDTQQSSARGGGGRRGRRRHDRPLLRATLSFIPHSLFFHECRRRTRGSSSAAARCPGIGPGALPALPLRVDRVHAPPSPPGRPPRLPTPVPAARP